MRWNSCSLPVVVAFLLTTLPGQAAAQDDEPVYERLRQAFKHDFLSLGTLLQTVADLQIDRSFPGSDGFSVANFRIALSGELDRGFGYFLQTNFAAGPGILDAMMYYRVSPQVTLDVGQFKAPFSREFLTSAGSIDFVNRSQVVTALAPGRQIGLQVRIGNAARTIGLDVGAFNGNATSANGNDSDNLLYAARFSTHQTSESHEGSLRTIDLGLNAAYSDDQASSFGSGFMNDFAGTRTLLGADARLVFGRVLLATDIIYARLEPDIGATRNPWGLHATAGYMIRPKTQALVRWDGFERDGPGGRSDWIIMGLNVWPTTVAEFQINYVIDADNAAPDNHQLLINFQFGF
jgi:phosphate-selective porin